MKYKRCMCERCNLYWDEEIQSTNDEVRSTNDVQEIAKTLAIVLLCMIGLAFLIIILP
jgi:hypothetical protein